MSMHEPFERTPLAAADSEIARPSFEEDEAGDPVCWLRRVCPACGTLADSDPPTICPACGADLPAE